jgi:hypothetical protein
VLWLGKTPVTDSGIEMVQKALPGCRIDTKSRVYGRRRGYWQ